MNTFKNGNVASLINGHICNKFTIETWECAWKLGTGGIYVYGQALFRLDNT